MSKKTSWEDIKNGKPLPLIEYTSRNIMSGNILWEDIKSGKSLPPIINENLKGEKKMNEFVVNLTDEQLQKLRELVDFEIEDGIDLEIAIKILIMSAVRAKERAIKQIRESIDDMNDLLNKLGEEQK